MRKFYSLLSQFIVAIVVSLSAYSSAVAQTGAITENLISENFATNTLPDGWMYYNTPSYWSLLNGRSDFDGNFIGVNKSTGKSVDIDAEGITTKAVTLYPTPYDAYSITFDKYLSGSTDAKLVLMTADGTIVKTIANLAASEKQTETHKFRVAEAGTYRIGFIATQLHKWVYLYIDEIKVTGTFEQKAFYNKNLTDLAALSNWASNPNGTGTAPGSFAYPNQVFHITNYADKDSIVLRRSWEVPGKYSKIVLGDNASAKPVTLKLMNGKTIPNSVIDVAANATLDIDANLRPTLGFLHAMSTVIFDGNASPEIPEGIDFGTVVFRGKPRGAASNKFTQTVKIKGKLKLQDTKLEIGDNDLELDYAATIENASASNYIAVTGKGRVRKALRAGEEVTLPVGDATTYHPVKIKLAAGATPDVFSVGIVDGVFDAYDADDVPTGTLRTEGTLKKTFVVSEDVKGGSDITLTLTWTEEDILAGFDPTNCHIMHYENGAWDEYFSGIATSTVGADGKTYYSISRPGIKSFSPMGVETPRSTPGPLPVELLDFNANATMANMVELKWATAQEQNNDYFAVERSEDGRNFSEIARVQGVGNTAARSNYSYTDASPLAGTSYYRLRQVDKDGTFELLPIRAVTLHGEQGLAIRLYPNPVGHGGTVQLAVRGLAQGEEATLVVTGLMGRTVLHKTFNQSTVTLATDRLKPGTYVVRVITKNGIKAKKLIIQ